MLSRQASCLSTSGTARGSNWSPLGGAARSTRRRGRENRRSGSTLGKRLRFGARIKSSRAENHPPATTFVWPRSLGFKKKEAKKKKRKGNPASVGLPRQIQKSSGRRRRRGTHLTSSVICRSPFYFENQRGATASTMVE